jgi:6-phosphogluconolactonase
MISKLSLFLLLALQLAAKPLALFFGTSGGESKGIYYATFDPQSGKFSQPKLASKIGSPGFLTKHPKHAIIYAVARWEGEAGVVGFKLEPQGELQELNRMACPDGGACHLSVHPSGKFLLTAQYGGGSIALFPVKEDGGLETPTIIEHKGGSKVIAKRQDAPHPHWVGFSPDGKYALVPDLGLDQIVIYKVDLDKLRLLPHATADSIPGGGPRHMRFSSDGRFIYLLNELNLSVTTFAWDASKGKARRLTTTPALSEKAKSMESFNSAAEILIHPQSPFVYSSNRGHDTVSVYQENSQGELQVIQVQPIRGAFPRNINLTPQADWLLAAGADSNTISAHRVDPQSGKITYQRGAVINVPSPICILPIE